MIIQVPFVQYGQRRPCVYDECLRPTLLLLLALVQNACTLQLEEGLHACVQDPKSSGHEEFMRNTKQIARVPMEQLVHALNEHVCRQAACLP